jgi:cyclase
MYRPRIIPVLLLDNDHLVKSVQFKNYTYIGDPINAVKLFNDMEADEIVFLDISAAKQKRLISLDFVKEVGEEANMPFAVGGGIQSVDDIRKIINAGAEKVIIGHQAAIQPGFIKEATEIFGSSTISVCIDVKKNIFGKERVYTHNGNTSHDYKPEEFARLMQENGVGEIIIQSISNDGTMNGYDIDLTQRVSQAVQVPVIALGGAGNLNHLQLLYQGCNVNGIAAGSIFVYQGKHKGVLINYPKESIKKIIYE